MLMKGKCRANSHTLEFRIGGTPRLFIIMFFATLPTLFSTPRLLISENFPSLSFYSRLPVYWFMCTVESGSVKPRQSYKTVRCTFFYKHGVYKHIQAEVWTGSGLEVILHVDKLPLYFLCSFCWYFHKIVWWFYFNEISDCCVFASLPFY